MFQFCCCLGALLIGYVPEHLRSWENFRYLYGHEFCYNRIISQVEYLMFFLDPLFQVLVCLLFNRQYYTTLHKCFTFIPETPAGFLFNSLYVSISFVYLFFPSFFLKLFYYKHDQLFSCRGYWLLLDSTTYGYLYAYVYKPARVPHHYSPPSHWQHMLVSGHGWLGLLCV